MGKPVFQLLLVIFTLNKFSRELNYVEFLFYNLGIILQNVYKTFHLVTSYIPQIKFIIISQSF